MHYRGWRSTKLALALLTMALITSVYAFTGFPAGEFGEFCMGLLAAAGIYSGASTAEKFAARPRAAPARAQVEPPEGDA